MTAVFGQTDTGSRLQRHEQRCTTPGKCRGYRTPIVVPRAVQSNAQDAAKPIAYVAITMHGHFTLLSIRFRVVTIPKRAQSSHPRL